MITWSSRNCGVILGAIAPSCLSLALPLSSSCHWYKKCGFLVCHIHVCVCVCIKYHLWSWSENGYLEYLTLPRGCSINPGTLAEDLSTAQICQADMCFIMMLCGNMKERQSSATACTGKVLCSCQSVDFNEHIDEQRKRSDTRQMATRLQKANLRVIKSLPASSWSSWRHHWGETRQNASSPCEQC